MNTYSSSQRSYIPSGGMNDVVRDWHNSQPQRVQTVASPSTLTECPRSVWLNKHKVPFTNDMGWGTKQRMMLGRIAENLFAVQLKDAGKLLWHWKDDVAGESVKFGMGEGLSRIEGTPDLLINLDGKILISDAKTSRADSFAYVPLDNRVWEDELWYHYKLQVEAYYLLCHKNKDWFDGTNKDAAVHREMVNGGEKGRLPLPEACHLFSYALDDGVVKREFTWKPSKETASEILHYANRWNKAYQSETCPPCQCTDTQTKFCKYGDPKTKSITKTGYELMTQCCGDELLTEVAE